MSKMTLVFIALTAMLPAVCVAQLLPEAARALNQPPTERLSVRARNPPHYPAEAVKARHEGTVVLLLLIGTNRDILERKVDKSSGWPELDKAALDASEHWDGGFDAGSKDGKRLEGYARVPVTFELPASSK